MHGTPCWDGRQGQLQCPSPGEALTRLHVSVGDVTANLGGDLIVERERVIPAQLDFLHGDMQSITIMTRTEEGPLTDSMPTGTEELVIREAQRRQRQRWLAVGFTVLAVAAATGLGLALKSNGKPPGSGSVPVGSSDVSPSSVVSRVLDHTLTASSAAFTFRQQTSAITVRGSGTVNFAAPSYSIEETISGFPGLFGGTTLTATRTPSGGFYEQDSGKAPTEETGDGLMRRQARTSVNTGPMAILARSPAGYAFGLLSLVPSDDLRLVGMGMGRVDGTSAMTYLFGDSGQCRGLIRTEVWTSAQSRILQVSTTQRGRGQVNRDLVADLHPFRRTGHHCGAFFRDPSPCE